MKFFAYSHCRKHVPNHKSVLLSLKEVLCRPKINLLLHIGLLESKTGASSLKISGLCILLRSREGKKSICTIWGRTSSTFACRFREYVFDKGAYFEQEQIFCSSINGPHFGYIYVYNCHYFRMLFLQHMFRCVTAFCALYLHILTVTQTAMANVHQRKKMPPAIPYRSSLSVAVIGLCL